MSYERTFNSKEEADEFLDKHKSSRKCQRDKRLLEKINDACKEFGKEKPVAYIVMVQTDSGVVCGCGANRQLAEQLDVPQLKENFDTVTSQLQEQVEKDCGKTETGVEYFRRKLKEMGVNKSGVDALEKYARQEGYFDGEEFNRKKITDGFNENKKDIKNMLKELFND